ncbi:MAG: NFACT RNA binding domain-containing protein [Bacteroidota bacterium]
MHNNYYFLQKLTAALELKLQGRELRQCFSQNKDELILIFDHGFIIKAALDSSFCCLSFPDNFHRARKNSVDLFEEIMNKQVLEVYQFENERCFSMVFKGGYQLLFKMHGNRSNLILFQNDKLLKIFKSNLKNDHELSISEMNRPLQQSYESFKKEHGDYTKLYPTFGKVIKEYLQELNIVEKSLEEQWSIIQHTVKALNDDNFYLCRYRNSTHLTLLEIGEILEHYSGPVSAVNHFFSYKIQQETFEKEKNKCINKVKQNLQKTRNYILSTSKKLTALETGVNYSQIADLIMANLHAINTGTEKVELANFYTEGTPVNIKLNRNISPQKNAENYYRKSKNQSRELEILRQNIDSKKRRESELMTQLDLVDQCKDLKGIRKLNKIETQALKKESDKPFKKVEYLGFKILVGKNAKSNDAMLRDHTQKNDLWLHAKDVSGSHVIVKEIPGKAFPKSLIEKAAELAAFYSKNKNESVCPVIYTPRKFVRKRKGDPAGSVVIDREKVILVKPLNWATQ